MFHDPALANLAKADPRPRSAVSAGVGFAGLAGMSAWVAVAHVYRLDGPYAALINVLACALPMVLWSVLVDKVYRNPSTGIDWRAVRPWRETLDISVTKLAGLWLTWGGSPRSTRSAASGGKPATPISRSRCGASAWPRLCCSCSPSPMSSGSIGGWCSRATAPGSSAPG
jgi:hypothetical protein